MRHRVSKARRINRKVKFPTRPWEVRYTKAVGPKLRQRARLIVRELYERGIVRRFIEWLNEQYGGYKYQLEKSDRGRDKAKLAELSADLRSTKLNLRGEVGRMTEQIFSAGSRHAFSKLGVNASWSLKSPAFKDALSTRQNLIKDVGDTQFDKLLDLVRTQVYENGASAVEPGMIDRVMTLAGREADWEAERIARTETLAVQAKSADTVYRANGVRQKEWIWSGSGYERHEGLDGEVVDMDEPFSNGLMFPGDDAGDPGETINCMCTFAPVVSDDLLDDIDAEGYVDE